MRQITSEIKGYPTRTIARILNPTELTSQWRPDIQFLVKTENLEDLTKLTKLSDSGLKNLGVVTSNKNVFENNLCFNIAYTEDVLEDGDVVAVSDLKRYVHVLFRESDIHHTVFLTNRCNSNCLMCSQPPTPQDDSWLINEAFLISSHMRISPKLLGFTGGEPLLLGAKLREVIDSFLLHHPEMEFDVLTNGRLLANENLANDLLANLPDRVTWMVPLYGHADFLHDFVVQSHGAFEETIQGLLMLQDYKQPIQVRIVLIEPVLKNLPDLCEFIGRNLPFVREVALIGCEPTGFALANKEICEIDLSKWFDAITEGVIWLLRLSLKPVIMNVPLCALPKTLWPYAHQSISDWKRVFAAECSTCSVKSSCSGLFSWYDKQWSPSKIIPIREISE